VGEIRRLGFGWVLSSAGGRLVSVYGGSLERFLIPQAAVESRFVPFGSGVGPPTNRHRDVSGIPKIVIISHLGSTKATSMALEKVSANKVYDGVLTKYKFKVRSFPSIYFLSFQLGDCDSRVLRWGA
jgi:hypothetical protein